MAATASSKVENWDDDDDLDFNGFQGSFNASTGTAQTSISSRLSVHSESVAGGDEDWNLVVNDEQSTAKAIQSAKQAGIPLPENVPQSALLGGTIKRLGKKKSRQRLNEDWDNDIEMPDLGAPLKLKAVQPPPVSSAEEYDDFDELEGSLGIRFGGIKRDARNRSSSASAMSPSLGSVTAESDVDDLGGLELPEGPMDFEAILKKRRAADAELSDLSQASPQIEQPATVNVHKKSRLLSDETNDDYLNDFDIGGGDLLSKRANKNIKVKSQKPTATAASRPATTLNFHDKPTDKPAHTRSHIPRPVSGSQPPRSRLEPVFETGASHVPRERRQPTTTSAQLLRSKRSMPVLSNRPAPAPTHKASIPYLPVGTASTQDPHGVAHRPMPYHLRRDSDPHRRGAQSPPLRPHSRLSIALTPDTPSRGSRQRPDLAPSALAREAAAKRTVTKPARRRNYGDGNELEIFDDLPTSSTKESKYVKQPVARGPPISKPSGLRQTQSRTDMRNVEPLKRNIAIPDRMTTPAPPRTPASPTKGFHQQQSSYTPSYLRDTAASRIARETKLGGNPRPRSEGPLMPLSTNWKAQVAARSPHTSPSAQRQKGPTKKPQLIRAVGSHVAKTEKGMIYNPRTLCWEGNENSVASFDLPPPLQTPTPMGRDQNSYMDRDQNSYMDRHHHPAPSASPPRPALIAPMSTASAQGVQVNGGMVFDPRQMKWLKLKDAPGGRDASGPLSPSITDGEEEDPFAGIEMLKDENSPMPAGAASVGMASPVSMAAAPGIGEVHEEFDLGPRFIQTQMEEEAMWRRRCERWFPLGGEAPRREEDGGVGWRWRIRELAGRELEGVM